MYEAGFEELNELYLRTLAAKKYAYKNYDVLVNRPHTYTLYGAKAHGLGAEVPSRCTPKIARHLLPKTRRKDFLIYHLDENYQVLRTIHMIEHTKLDCIYHHFYLDGVKYAVPFKEDRETKSGAPVAIIQYKDGKPACYVLGRRSFIFSQFYEYISDEKMMVSTYRYWAGMKNGLPADWNAPPDAPNYPIERYCFEEVPYLVDFKEWL